MLSKVSIPVLQSAAAIYRIAEMDYSPTNSIFLQVLINKKYNLPIRVIDAVCEHFARFLKDERRMVVSWHQCLLTFVQRYKNDLTAEQKDMIRELIRIHSHYQITPLIRYELDNSVTRGTGFILSFNLFCVWLVCWCFNGFFSQFTKIYFHNFNSVNIFKCIVAYPKGIGKVPISMLS